METADWRLETRETGDQTLETAEDGAQSISDYLIRVAGCEAAPKRQSG